MLVLAGQLEGSVARQALIDLIDRSENPGEFATERTRLVRQLEAHGALERKLAAADREVASASARLQAARDELNMNCATSLLRVLPMSRIQRPESVLANFTCRTSAEASICTTLERNCSGPGGSAADPAAVRGDQA